MEVIYFRSSFYLECSAITVGTFDGLHLGHQQILQKLNGMSAKLKVPSVLVTFDPHPRHFLFPTKETKLLTTLEEKKYLLSLLKKNIDYFVVIPFNQDIANMSGVEFLKTVIAKHFLPKGIITGYNHHFGKQRKDSTQLIKDFCEENSLLFEVVEERKANQTAISSTNIRKNITEGNVIFANNQLGYRYTIHGKVVSGEGLGREIGFPTANIQYSPLKQLPQYGVYAVMVQWQKQLYQGVANIGKRPTIKNAQGITVEVHIFDFSDLIYKEDITLFFIEKIRDEQQFSSITMLQKQIAIDCEKAKNITSQIDEVLLD